jgi:hypothetical protein
MISFPTCHINSLYALTLLLLITRPAVGVTPDDFSVSGRITQDISVQGTRTVVIRCFCPNREVRRDAAAKGMRLRIEGTHSSVGYHGLQEKPTRLDEDLLRFVERWDGESLTIESREYTYIHHAFILDKLDIVAPPALAVIVKPLDRNELEGRRVGK